VKNRFSSLCFQIPTCTATPRAPTATPSTASAGAWRRTSASRCAAQAQHNMTHTLHAQFQFQPSDSILSPNFGGKCPSSPKTERCPHTLHPKPHPTTRTHGAQAIVSGARAQARHTSDDAGRSALLLHTKRDLYLLAFQAGVGHSLTRGGSDGHRVRDGYTDYTGVTPAVTISVVDHTPYMGLSLPGVSEWLHGPYCGCHQLNLVLTTAK
jgi:hypothetical protein